MKKTTYGIILTMALVFGFTGCSEIEDAIDKAKGDDKATTSTSIKTSATIRYSDGSTMGVTRAEDVPVDGGFQIYHIGTAQVVGFIGADAVVNNIGGRDLGVCQGATVSDNGVSGDCTVPTVNPSLAPVQSTPQPISQPAPSADQVYTTTPSGCEDRRDGTFDISWDQQTCNAHGYFYCTLDNICTDQTINIAECL